MAEFTHRHKRIEHAHEWGDLEHNHAGIDGVAQRRRPLPQKSVPSEFVEFIHDYTGREWLEMLGWGIGAVVVLWAFAMVILVAFGS
jgi:hypothetical protein